MTKPISEIIAEVRDGSLDREKLLALCDEVERLQRINKQTREIVSHFMATSEPYEKAFSQLDALAASLDGKSGEYNAVFADGGFTVRLDG